MRLEDVMVDDAFNGVERNALLLSSRQRLAVRAVRRRGVEVPRAQDAAPGVADLVALFFLDEKKRSLPRCRRARKATDRRRDAGSSNRLRRRRVRAPFQPPGKSGCRGLRGIPGQTAASCEARPLRLLRASARAAARTGTGAGSAARADASAG